MIEIVGSVHFFTIVTLWTYYLEKKVEPWPEWTVPLVFVILIAGIAVAAGGVGIAYGGNP